MEISEALARIEIQHVLWTYAPRDGSRLTTRRCQVSITPMELTVTSLSTV